MESGSLLSENTASQDFDTTDKSYCLCCRHRERHVQIYDNCASHDADDVSTYLRHKIACVMKNVVFIIFIRCICFMASATLFFIGFRYRNKCPLEPAIPVFLLVDGCVLALLCALWTLRRCCKSEANVENTLDSYGILIKVQVMFLILWTVSGSVWIYSELHKANFLDAGSKHFCEPSVFWVAFGLVTFTYVILFLGVFVSACICLFAPMHEARACAYDI